jgi:hypothetical protein
VLYRKRDGARRLHEHGVFARFRYNDLKEAARDCGGRGPLCKLIGVEGWGGGVLGWCGGAQELTRWVAELAMTK